MLLPVQVKEVLDPVLLPALVPMPLFVQTVRFRLLIQVLLPVPPGPVLLPKQVQLLAPVLLRGQVPMLLHAQVQVLGASPPTSQSVQVQVLIPVLKR